MFQRNSIALAAFAVAATIIFAWTGTSIAALGFIDKQETKCGSQLGKNGEKLNKTYLKEVSKCRNAVISLKDIGSCPNAKNDTKIDKVKGKLAGAIAKHCVSICDASGLPSLTHRRGYSSVYSA